MHKLKRQKKKLKTFLLIILIILLITTLLILFVDLGKIKNPFMSKKEQQEFAIRDYCSLIVGKLIHTINSGDDCRIQCRAACETRNSEFTNASFISKENDCHLCSCICDGKQ
jgi:flagellar basal body-associated protein FliL